MSICKACGASVDWKNDGNGWKCHNAGTNTDHWDSCSGRRWEQTKATGTRFEGVVNDKGQTIAGYANSIHGTKLESIDCLEIVGKRYKPDGCDCGLPPWELCRANCKHAVKLKEAA